MAECSHLDQVVVLEPQGPIAGCEECLKIELVLRGRRDVRPCSGVSPEKGPKKCHVPTDPRARRDLADENLSYRRSGVKSLTDG